MLFNAEASDIQEVCLFDLDSYKLFHLQGWISEKSFPWSTVSVIFNLNYQRILYKTELLSNVRRCVQKNHIFQSVIRFRNEIREISISYNSRSIWVFSFIHQTSLPIWFISNFFLHALANDNSKATRNYLHPAKFLFMASFLFFHHNSSTQLVKASLWRW